jgi:ribosomal protein S18 acetylase RimI-like enzyme
MDVRIRSAGAGDVERIGQIMNDPPGAEMLAMVGDRAIATAFGNGLLALEHIPNPDRPTVVGEIDGDVVGFLQYTLGSRPMKLGLGHIRLALRVAGVVRSVRSIPKQMARQRVEVPAPPDAFYIAEFHVDPARRGQGIGSRLLDWADDEARRSGRLHLALNTQSTNRARALYERHGFKVTGTREDAKYERYTGIPGRILMEKWLD